MKRSSSLPEVVINPSTTTTTTTTTTTSKTHDSEKEKWKKREISKINAENKENSINEQQKEATEAVNVNVSVPENSSLAKQPLAEETTTRVIRDPYHMIKITEIIEINSKNCSSPSDLGATNTNSCFIEPSSTTTMTTTTTMMNNSESDENSSVNCFSENIDALNASNEKPRPFRFFETRFDSVKSNREESTCLNYVSNSSRSNNLRIPRPKIKFTGRESLRETSEPRRLPILVEKVSQTCIEDFMEAQTEKKSEEVIKPAEIVLEIINISGLNESADGKSTNNSINNQQNVHEDSIAAQSMNNAKPKKITIRITGKTRSASSDKMSSSESQQLQNTSQQQQLYRQQQQQQQSLLIKPAPAFFSPLTPFKPPQQNGTALKNSPSFDVGIYDSFRPIEQQRTDDSFNRFYTSSIDDYNPSVRCQLASEEDSTLTLSETKFDLDKFKSYLNAFNTNNQYRPTISTNQFQQRSTSMPPPIGKINNNYNQYHEQDRLLNTYENDRYGVVRSIKPTNDRTGTIQRRTAYNGRNFGFLEEQSMRKPAPWKSTAASSASVSDSEEPIWTYRDQPQVSSNNAKRSSTLQSQQPQTPQKSTAHSNAASKRFGCGLFNKSSRLSVKLEEDEEDDNEDDEENENDGFDENEAERLNLKECSEFSNRSLQMSKSPRFDHLSLSHLNSPSARIPTLNRLNKESHIQSENHQHQSRKKISSYYNDYYSKQNRMFGARAASASASADLSESSTTRYIDEDATTLTSNNVDEENDTEVDCDCNQIDEMSGDEDTLDAFDITGRRNQELYAFKPNSKFTTFLPNNISSNSPKTPKLVRKVLFADQI